MALPSSGQLTFEQIGTELSISTSGPHSLRSMSSTAGKSVPDSVEEFYNYSHVTYGRCYGSESITALSMYLKRITAGNTYLCDGSSSTVRFTATQNEYVDARRTTTLGYTSFHAVDLDWYKRAKNTSGSWGVPSNTLLYESQDKSCTFSSYDYWFDVYDNECLTGENNIYISPTVVKNVKDIKVGDKVYTAPEDDHTKLDYYEVHKAERVMADKIATVTFDTGLKIRCSTSHKLMTYSDQGEVAGNKLFMLEPGADVLSVIGTEFRRNRIVSIDISDKPEYVYKIEVETAHTYFTEDNLYHHNEK